MGDPINTKAVVWARGRIGQQVGRGECWDLADQALRKAGGASSTTTGKDDDYVWGDLVELPDVQPGDVLQFRDFKVTTTTTTDVTFDDGSGHVQDKEHVAIRGHHVAIVDGTDGAGGIYILEQNVKPLGKRMQRHLLPVKDSGPRKKTTEKLLKHASGKTKPATVVETTTITISGKVWAYRPKPQGAAN